MNLSASVLYLGMIPPTKSGFTQITADHRLVERKCLAHRENACSNGVVVAAFPQWAETYRLNRYPSPDGRSCAVMHGPPFFPVMPGFCGNGRRPAQTRGQTRHGFDAPARIALSARRYNRTVRGKETCRDFEFSRRPFFWWVRWRPVATRYPNRRFSARRPVSAPRPWWADRFLPGRPSARRATWPSAKSIRKNACKLNFAPGNGSRLIDKAIAAHPRAGGLFYVIPPRCTAGAGKKKGT